MYVHVHANAPPFFFFLSIFSDLTKEVKIIFSSFFHVYTYLHTYRKKREFTTIK